MRTSFYPQCRCLVPIMKNRFAIPIFTGAVLILTSVIMHPSPCVAQGLAGGGGQQASVSQQGQHQPQEPGQPPRGPKAQPPGQAQAQGQQAQQPQKTSGQPTPKDDKQSKRVDLGKFVSVATTPVGLIIAGAITISFFQQKRIDSSAQVRALITELRKKDVDPERCKALIAEINVYKARLKAIRVGKQMVASTIILFVIANISSSLGLIWPEVRLFQGLVIGGMLLGMLTLGLSLFTELYDSWHNGRELNLELADFDRIAQTIKEPREGAQQRAA
jgi:hypothetical protein